MNIQLSISLLASDRPDTLKKCLDSLTPILNTIPSELIVVFTGTNPEVEEMIKQYTDQIIPFTWCDDFAAARNAGLAKASGEWFLYIDDDEWFENTEEICEFFQSGQYKSYKSASYIQRNYHSFDGSSYNDFETQRMALRTEGVRFRYSIHEELYPSKLPLKKLHDFVHHYAYLADGQKKRQRNIPLLLKELEKDDKNTKMYMQLVQEFIGGKEFREAEKYCRKGIEVLRRERKSLKTEEWLLAFYPWVIAAQGDYERTWKEAERILQKDKPYKLACAQLYILLGKTGISLERYCEGFSYIKKYQETMTWLKNNPDVCDSLKVLSLTYKRLKNSRKELYTAGLEYAAKLEDVNSLEEVLRWILKDKNDENKLYYMREIDAWKRRNHSQETALLRCFSHIHSDDPYLLLQQALYKEAVGETGGAEKLFLKCVQSAPEEPYLQWQLIYMAIRNTFDLSPFIEALTLSVWTDYAITIVNRIKLEECTEFAAKVEKSLVTYPLHYAILQRLLLEKQMRFGNLEGQELSAVTGQYAESVVGYYRCLYKEELFAEKMWFCLPSTCCFAMLVVRALACEKNGKYSECLGYLRRAIQTQPDMKPVVTKLLEYVEQHIEAASAEQPVSEFAALGAQVKATVREMITNRQYKDALPILSQLEQLLPNDAEVLEMKQTIQKNSDIL